MKTSVQNVRERKRETLVFVRERKRGGGGNSKQIFNKCVD